MNNNVTKILLLFALVVIMILIVDKCNGCHGNKKPVHKDTLSDKTDTSWKVKKDTVTFVKPGPERIVYRDRIKPYYIYNKDTIWRLTGSDTTLNLMLDEFFANVYYDDTTTTKEGDSVRYTAKVAENRLDSMQIFILNRYPEITRTITLLETKNRLYLGGTGEFGTQNNLGPSAMITTKRGWAFGGSVKWDTRTWKQKTFGATVLRQIGK